MRVREAEVRFSNLSQHARQLVDSLKVLGAEITWSRKFDDNTYIALVKLSDSYQSKFGITREVLTIFSTHTNFEARDLAAHKHISASLPADRLVEEFLTFSYNRDPRHRQKLHDWNREGNVFKTIIPLEPNVDPRRGAETILQSLQTEIPARDWYQNYSVVTGDSFYGRRRLISDISGRLREGAIVGVFGMRKSGKTSLVNEIGRRFEMADPDTCVFISIDLESLENADKSAAFETTVISLIAASFRNRLRESRVRTQELSGLHPGSTIGQLRTALTASVKDAEKKGIKILLSLDEVESLVGTDREMGSQDRAIVPVLLGILRSLVQEHKNFNVTLAGLTTAPVQKDELYGRENPIFSWAVPYFVPPLTTNEANELVTDIGRRSSYSWTAGALEELNTISGGNILMLRTLCSKVTRTRTGPLFTHDDVLASVRSWRRENVETFQGILASVQRHYPMEYDICREVMTGITEIDFVDDNFPSQSNRLIGLDLFREGRDGTLQLGPIPHLLSPAALKGQIR